MQTPQKSLRLNAGTGQLGQHANLNPTNQEQQCFLTSPVRTEKLEYLQSINQGLDQKTVLVLPLQRTNVYKSEY